jgi:hypothetical protein
MEMNTPTLMAIGAVLTVVIVGQSVLLWRLLKALGGVQRLDEKFGHFGDALSLLTETTESGFKAVAAELSRTSPTAEAAMNAAKKTPRLSSARITSAARRGRTVPEIAAAEELSEGEVRLRLHLAKQAAQTKSPRVPASVAHDAAPAASTSKAASSRRTRAIMQEQANGALRA